MSKADEHKSSSVGDETDRTNENNEVPGLARVVSHEEAFPDVEERASCCQQILRAAALVWTLCACPYICRNLGLSSAQRCAMVISAVLSLTVTETMPIFCTSMFIPVLGTMCAVLGDGRSTVATSTLLVANIFNNVSFTVLGALVINGIFVKCKLEQRLMEGLVAKFAPNSPAFLLLLVMGGMAICSILFSGSLTLLAALKPVIMTPSGKEIVEKNVAKRLLLGIAFCANAGSSWFPISSPVNLITISLLKQFDDVKVSLWAWTSAAVSISTVVMFFIWFWMLQVFPASQQERKTRLPYIAEYEVLTRMHYLFLLVAVTALVLMTLFTDQVEPFVGHPACICMCVVVLTFGSGFMTTKEFVSLDWDLLMLVGGTNVMAFLVRETGLAALITSELVAMPLFARLPYWGVLAILASGTVCVSTLCTHSLTGVLLLPLVVALGVKLQAAEMTAILIAVIIPFGMGLPTSSFDNVASYQMSKAFTKSSFHLAQSDYRMSGMPLTIFACLTTVTLGFFICIQNYSLPPPVIISETGTPEALKPKVATENLPEEARQVQYNDKMVDWKTFQKMPEKKAFAVGELKEGMKTRPWAAAWGHRNQDAAEVQAIRDCQRFGSSCRIIWPPAGKEGNRSAFFMTHVRHTGPSHMWDTYHQKSVRGLLRPTSLSVQSLAPAGKATT